MITVTNTEKLDYYKVLTLINHVFGKENSSLKMEDIFTDLLSQNNMEHMRIIKVNGKPVSVINYIINEINMKGSVLKAANIGAVCTHEDYRGRGYANRILKDCLENMRSEGVDLLYVSGEINLYTKNSIHITGKMYTFNIDKNYLAEHKQWGFDEYEVKECYQEDMHLLSDLYDMEAVRYIRDKQKFVDLARRVPGASVYHHAAKTYRIEVNGQMQGYFICALIPGDNGDFNMELIEYSGNRKAVLVGIIKTMIQSSPASISGYASWFDTEMLKSLEEYEIITEVDSYPGTMRIVDFSRFMQKVKQPYTRSKDLDALEFYESNGKYIIRLEDKELVIEDDKTMHDLFLGSAMELLDSQYISGDKILFDKLKLILPIPVPYPYGLNYI